MAENQNTNSNKLIDQLTEKLDSVTRLDPKPLSLSDLPNEILGEIVGKLDLVNRMRTRKVSRRLRGVVDTQKAYYKTIRIRTKKEHRVDIRFDELVAHYSKSGCLIADEDNSDSLNHKFIEDNNFMEIALNDLAIALKHPNFQLKCFRLFLATEAKAENAKILNFFESLKSPIHVKSFYMDGNNDILPILSKLKPGALEQIALFGECVGLGDQLFGQLFGLIKMENQLFKMDQWKKAKEAQLGGARETSIPIDIEDFLHFDRFVIRYVDSFSPQEVLRLRDVFSKSDNFERCELKFHRPPENIGEIARALRATVVQLLYGPVIINHRYSIPATNKFLQFEINRNELIIQRKL